MGILEEYKQKREKVLQMGGAKEVEKQASLSFRLVAGEFGQKRD